MQRSTKPFVAIVPGSAEQEIHPEIPKGDDIPISSRILAICDAYDSMTSPRTYRVPFTPDEAFEELRRCAGTQFDPELVERFIEKICRGRATFQTADRGRLSDCSYGVGTTDRKTGRRFG